MKTIKLIFTVSTLILASTAKANDDYLRQSSVKSYLSQLKAADNLLKRAQELQPATTGTERKPGEETDVEKLDSLLVEIAVGLESDDLKTVLSKRTKAEKSISEMVVSVKKLEYDKTLAVNKNYWPPFDGDVGTIQSKIDETRKKIAESRKDIADFNSEIEKIINKRGFTFSKSQFATLQKTHLAARELRQINMYIGSAALFAGFNYQMKQHSTNAAVVQSYFSMHTLLLRTILAIHQEDITFIDKKLGETLFKLRAERKNQMELASVNLKKATNETMKAGYKVAIEAGDRKLAAIEAYRQYLLAVRARWAASLKEATEQFEFANVTYATAENNSVLIDAASTVDVAKLFDFNIAAFETLTVPTKEQYDELHQIMTEKLNTDAASVALMRQREKDAKGEPKGAPIKNKN